MCTLGKEQGHAPCVFLLEQGVTIPELVKKKIKNPSAWSSFTDCENALIRSHALSAKGRDDCLFKKVVRAVPLGCLLYTSDAADEVDVV